MELEEYKDAWSDGFEECKRLFKVMEPAQPVSRQIRDLRKARGLTQEGLAKLTGMKAKQVSQHGMQLTMLVGQKGRPMLPKTITRMISDQFKALELPHTR